MFDIPTAELPAVVLHDRQATFVALLPVIEVRAHAAFRHLRCPHDRDDAVAEVFVRAWAIMQAAPPRARWAAAMLAAEAIKDVHADLVRQAPVV